MATPEALSAAPGDGPGQLEVREQRQGEDEERGGHELDDGHEEGVQAQHPEHRAEQDDEDREDEASTEAHGEPQALRERRAPLSGAGS